MKKLPLKLLLCLMGWLLVLSPAGAQTTTTGLSVLGDTESEWPGIHYQILLLKRIPPGRLLILLQLNALAGTPSNGVKILGPMGPLVASVQAPLPFSFDTSTLTDMLSGNVYPVLPSVAPLGRAYRVSQIRTTLLPGKVVWVNMQFACPPPPPSPPKGQLPKKQMLSFVFPKGLQPVVIELPPLPPVAAAAPP